MNHGNANEEPRPRMVAVHALARWLTIYGTPFFLAVIAAYLVGVAFQRGFYPGMRSLASALLPVVVGSFLYAFRKEILRRVAGASNAIGFVIGATMGLLVMAGLRVFGATTIIPLAELLLSGCFAVLVFSSASSPEDRGLSYYYGVMSGALLYIILFGFPVLGGPLRS